MRNELLVLALLIIIAIIALHGITSEINKNYSVEYPAYGGTLREGIIGNPRFINPALAHTDADRDMSELMFTGLMRYDKNGSLRPALLQKYEVSPDGLDYTVTLKNNLKWSNGKSLTADDVIFTIQLAKNPVAQSPKRPNWEGVEVEKINTTTVHFHLKKAYAPFLENLTLGIIPKYLWEQIPVSQISLAKFNTDSVVGSGPYKVESIKTDPFGSIVSATLSANAYFVLGKPFIKTVVINFYPNEETAVKELKNGSLDSLGGVSPKYVKDLSSAKEIHATNLQRIIAIFLNQGTQKSLSSPDIRKALNMATDKKTIIEKVLGNYGVAIQGPLPPNIVDEKSNPQTTAYNPELAKILIQTAAKKLKKNISLTLTTATTPELVEIANLIKDMWGRVGVEVRVKTFNLTDLEQLVIGPRRYEAFLYGEEVVGENPDPFAFWHSSQRAHPGYNIALYANSKVDKLLEEVRTTQDQIRRDIVYKDIHKEIESDLPAIFLFSPSYIYATAKDLGGANINSISTGSQRFSTINEWYISKQYVWKIFAK